jgi:hypothetical protein
LNACALQGTLDQMDAIQQLSKRKGFRVSWHWEIAFISYRRTALPTGASN